jgi:hypothetical protein
VKLLEQLVVVMAIVLLAGMLALGSVRTTSAPASDTLPVQQQSTYSPPPVHSSLASTDSHTAGQSPTPPAGERRLRPEVIQRLPLQIQTPVAATPLRATPPVSLAEIERLPLQIQDQLRQVQPSLTGVVSAIATASAANRADQLPSPEAAISYP